jgi:hypothetical protein
MNECRCRYCQQVFQRSSYRPQKAVLGETMPMACQDWASTKAAYRFFSNERVSARDILAGHFQATRARFRVTEGWVLLLHDTTEFSFQREDLSR